MSDFTAEAMQKTLDIATPEIHTLTDDMGVTATFSTKQLCQVRAHAPKLPDTLSVFTLAGFADLVRAKIDDYEFPKDFIIHVEKETTVALRERVSDDYGRRMDLVSASPVPFKQFSFNQWINQEEFVIAVAALFAESEDREYVLKLASTLTNEAITTHEDDGFTQKGTAKAGLRTKESITLKPRVLLAPYRTFPELEQPLSEFVFRARILEGAGPMLMLVEADGGRWKIDAIQRIKTALEAMNLGIPIVA